ncbi:protachykinin-like [Lates japonicus]|uniref:Protachykinin-like protein n=1 Tax=Lates japonicus TaxID=270547 RepID=A0AAD3MG55_LATJO|nr:protachykinin-like protein [Lates japonicus]
MEIVKVVVILVLLLTNVFCQDMDDDSWREGSEENKWTNPEGIQDILVRMIRKPGPRQYLGLMGKKDSAKVQTARKRHKFQTFVGLMGRRSFDDQGAQ